MACLKYFAYGSNMSPKRLQKRVPSASVVGVFSLVEYTLKFHKIGKDGSAKGDAFFTGEASDTVLGVLYNIEPEEKRWLDAVEGLGDGYEEKEVHLKSLDGQVIVGFLYYATNINSALLPFSWYVHHVLCGAEIAKLPKRYVEEIRRVQVVEDEDRQRDVLERSLYHE